MTAVLVLAALAIAALMFFFGRSLGSASGKTVGEQELRAIRAELS